MGAVSSSFVVTCFVKLSSDSVEKQRKLNMLASNLLLSLAAAYLKVSVDAWSGNPCKDYGPCHCVLNNGSVIDLTADGLSNGSAKYSMLSYGKEKKTIYYSYNPCFPFSENFKKYLTLEPACENVAACWYENMSSVIVERPIQTGFGKQTTATFFWEIQDYRLGISYTTVSDEGLRINDLNVILYCNKDSETNEVVVQSAKKDALWLNYHSKCACLDGCPLVLETEVFSLSVGSVLVIVFFSLLITYCSVGVLWKTLFSTATGRDVVPHYEFWSSLPSLIKDGAVYTFSCCRKPTSPRTITFDD